MLIKELLDLTLQILIARYSLAESLRVSSPIRIALKFSSARTEKILTLKWLTSRYVMVPNAQRSAAGGEQPLTCNLADDLRFAHCPARPLQ